MFLAVFKPQHRKHIARLATAAIGICALVQLALADDDLCTVDRGCLSAILNNSVRAVYGFSPDHSGRGETAELMWCQLAVTVYSWRRPGIDPGRVDITGDRYAVREFERLSDGSVKPISWVQTGGQLGRCASTLSFADPGKLEKARAAAVQWAKAIHLAPEPLAPAPLPDVIPLPPASH